MELHENENVMVEAIKARPEQDEKDADDSEANDLERSKRDVVKGQNNLQKNHWARRMSSFKSSLHLLGMNKVPAALCVPVFHFRKITTFCERFRPYWPIHLTR
jgi:hypothetical protein